MDTELNKYIKLLENSPNDSKLNSWIGNYYKNNKDFIKALKYYKKAFEVDSQNEYYCRIIGDIYETLGEMNKAQNYYKKAVYLENNQIEQGLKKYIDAIKENPSDAEGYFLLGAYYERYKRYDKSLEYYLKAFNLNNKSELYCNKVGRIYEKLGKEEKANEYYDAAVELNPSAKEKKALLKKIDDNERISVKDFFEGNYVQGSFAANACTDEIDVREFFDIFKEIEKKDNVKEVYIEICDAGIEEEWPYSDTAFVVTTANEEEIRDWFKEAFPSEIDEHVSIEKLEDGYKLYCLWWD